MQLSHALKEWDIAVKALNQGKMIVLLRKGGIKEISGKFTVKYDQILLYPTHEHQKPHLLKSAYQSQVTPVPSGWHPETILINSWANITDILTLTQQEILNRLLPYHIWNETFVEERFNWKPRQPLYLLLLRVYQLPEVKNIPYSPNYSGCQSWIDLDQPISLTDSQPVLSDETYKQQRNHLLNLLNPPIL